VNGTGRGWTARWLYVAGGSLAVGLGTLGVFLPLLPTTPFLLLAAWCYARGSRRFHTWLLGIRWCGAYIRAWQERRGVPMRFKVLAIVALWVSISSSALLVVNAWWLRGVLWAIAVGVTVHLVKLPTLRVPVEDPCRPGAGVGVAPVPPGKDGA